MHFISIFTHKQVFLEFLNFLHNKNKKCKRNNSKNFSREWHHGLLVTFCVAVWCSHTYTYECVSVTYKQEGTGSSWCSPLKNFLIILISVECIWYFYIMFIMGNKIMSSFVGRRLAARCCSSPTRLLGGGIPPPRPSRAVRPTVLFISVRYRDLTLRRNFKNLR